MTMIGPQRSALDPAYPLPAKHSVAEELAFDLELEEKWWMARNLHEMSQRGELITPHHATMLRCESIDLERLVLHYWRQP
jgi:hypothetical protein